MIFIIQLSTFLSPFACLVLIPGQLTGKGSAGEMNPKLWVALSGGKVVVFDAASWSMLQDCIQAGESQLVSGSMLHIAENIPLWVDNFYFH